MSEKSGPEYQPWSKIPKDYRTIIDGKRYCLAMTSRGTALVPWIGPCCGVCGKPVSFNVRGSGKWTHTNLSDTPVPWHSPEPAKPEKESK